MRTRTKILATTAVLGVIGVLIAIGTSAFFSASTTSNTNIAATGAMAISANNTVYFDSTAPGAGKMRPVPTLAQARTQNSVVDGSVVITNNSDFGVNLAVQQIEVGGTSLAPGSGTPAGGGLALFKHSRLCVSTALAGTCDIYSGPFDIGNDAPDPAGDAVASADQNVPGGILAPAGTRTVYFEVWMLEDGAAPTDNRYQNQTATARFRFNAS